MAVELEGVRKWRKNKRSKIWENARYLKLESV
jgi:hypothetical protein